MVSFQEFVSIYAAKCGGDATEAADVWNREKDEIKRLSRAEVTEALTCP